MPAVWSVTTILRTAIALMFSFEYDLFGKPSALSRIMIFQCKDRPTAAKLALVLQDFLSEDASC
jgi:hypothetical protein